MLDAAEQTVEFIVECEQGTPPIRFLAHEQTPDGTRVPAQISFGLRTCTQICAGTRGPAGVTWWGGVAGAI